MAKGKILSSNEYRLELIVMPTLARIQTIIHLDCKLLATGVVCLLFHTV